MNDHEYEKQWINRLGANKPVLQHPDELKHKILSSIDQSLANQKLTHRTDWLVWRKIAAILLLVMGIGNWTWQEITTWNSVNQMVANSQNVIELSVSVPGCQQNMRRFMHQIGIVPIRQFKPGYMIRISMYDIARLQNTHSPYLAEAMLFLRAIEKYYPDEYIRFMVSGETWLPASRLTNDKHFCDLLDHP